MTLQGFLARVKQCPLIASVQASDGPVDHPDTLRRFAQASLQEGVTILRLQGVKNIRVIKPAVPVPVIGLIKRSYPGSDVFITPAAQDIDAIAQLGCELVAIDATQRERPYGATVADLVKHAHRRKLLVLADCDTLESAIAAAEAGADLIGTTLAGYTPNRDVTAGPDLDLLRQICRAVKTPVIAEGRFSQKWEVEAALRCGAVGVVVGGALNDPVKQTRAMLPSPPPKGNVGAVDIGGTWLRFGVFAPDWQLLNSAKIANPATRAERLSWIRSQVEEHNVEKVGLGTGGIVDPTTGVCWTAKEYLMPDQIGIEFSERNLGVPTVAHGDGHAAVWGHACLPQYAGLRVASLALGTGVGCGFVQEGRIWAGPRGEYPRLNDQPTRSGASYEDLLGGLNLSSEPSKAQQAAAVEALESAVAALQGYYFPDVVVVSGSVGLSPWMRPQVESLGAVVSPFGNDAGLYGAAALALFPHFAG